jgi:hypothetical protein
MPEHAGSSVARRCFTLAFSIGQSNSCMSECVADCVTACSKRTERVMLEFLLVLVGIAGIAISIAAKFVFARRSDIYLADTGPESCSGRDAKLFAKPGRADAGSSRGP